MIRSILFLFACFLPSILFASASPRLRSDLKGKLSAILCQRSTPLSPTELWDAGVYDAQAELAWIEADQAIGLQDLDQAAIEQASRSKHRGYAFDLCSPTKAWIMTTPAPQPIIRIGDSSIDLDTQAFKERCGSFDLDTAAAKGGPPRSLHKKIPANATAIAINSSFLPGGTLSMTCHPADKRSQGPELWALVPIGAWDRSEIPYFKESGGAGVDDLIAWIQRVRAANRLIALNSDQSILKRFAAELAGKPSIRHPRPLLLDQARELKKMKGKFLGENRVKALAARDMAWLLWNSPQHRRLLLHKQANAIGFNLSHSDKEKLFVMVMARF